MRCLSQSVEVALWLLQQVTRRLLFYHMPIIEDKNPVVVHDAFEVMCDLGDGAGEIAKFLLDLGILNRVDGASCLVHHQELGALQECACHEQYLPLPAGEIVAGCGDGQFEIEQIRIRTGTCLQDGFQDLLFGELL